MGRNHYQTTSENGIFAVMSESVEDLPAVESDQVEAVMDLGNHYQGVILHTDEWGTYDIRYDNQTLRVLKPVQMFDDDGNALFMYEIIGHHSIEEDLPFPLDLPTMERYARILITLVNTEKTDEATEAEEASE